MILLLSPSSYSFTECKQPPEGEKPKLIDLCRSKKTVNRKKKKTKNNFSAEKTISNSTGRPKDMKDHFSKIGKSAIKSKIKDLKINKKNHQFKISNSNSLSTQRRKLHNIRSRNHKKANDKKSYSSNPEGGSSSNTDSTTPSPTKNKKLNLSEINGNQLYSLRRHRLNSPSKLKEFKRGKK